MAEFTQQEMEQYLSLRKEAQEVQVSMSVGSVENGWLIGVTEKFISPAGVVLGAVMHQYVAESAAVVLQIAEMYYYPLVPKPTVAGATMPEVLKDAVERTKRG